MLKERTTKAVKVLRLTTIDSFILNCPIKKVKDAEIVKHIFDAQVSYLLKDYRSAIISHKRSSRLLETIKRDKVSAYNLTFIVFDLLALGLNENMKLMIGYAERLVQLPRPNFFVLSACNHQKVIGIYRKMKKANFFKCKARFIQASIMLLLTYDEMGDYCSYSKCTKKFGTL